MRLLAAIEDCFGVSIEVRPSARPSASPTSPPLIEQAEATHQLRSSLGDEENLMRKNTIMLVAAGLLVTAVRIRDGDPAIARPGAPRSRRLPVSASPWSSPWSIRRRAWRRAGWTSAIRRIRSERAVVVEVDLANYGGLILAHPDPWGPTAASRSGIARRIEFGDFLEVQLQLASGEALARVPVNRSAAVKRPDGFFEVWLPIGPVEPGRQAIRRE